MQFALWLSAAALVIVIVLGLRAFIDPQWAARVFRVEGTSGLGAALAGAHAGALIFTAQYLLNGHYLVGVIAAGALAALAAGWGGAFVSEVVALIRKAPRAHVYVVAAKLAMTLAAGAPWLLWRFGG
ncbi:MAG: hypothetical protein NVV62_05930 [Terricaulis sp.]|nr:hypothetical protein [Terricaulis sp.]